MKRLTIAVAMAAMVAGAEQYVDISGVGTQKFSVQIDVAHPAFKRCLAKNLELSGLFQVAGSGSVKVSGAPGAIRAEGRGKSVSTAEAFADDKAARMAARKFSDSMVAAFSNGQQKGFATKRVLFLNRGKKFAKEAAIPAELCVSYADGFDIRQLTSDKKMVIFQRWMKDGENIFYISDKNGATQIWQMNVSTGRRSVKWSFKGTPTGIAVSPDGAKLAAVLSVHGNPELYLINIGASSWTRLTNTPYEVEGQPTFSPDGTKLAFVRGVNTQQIWVIDLATRKERRLTSRGRKNVDPDWGPDGRIAYIAGATVSVMSPAEGDRAAQVVAEAANWEHPSWSCDGRHIAANRDRALFVIDTLEGGDRPRQMFSANGNFISPCWSK